MTTERLKRICNNRNSIVKPLYQNVPLRCTKDQALNFKELQQIFTQSPVLRSADHNLPYQLTADASQTGFGAVLTQTDDSGCCPVAYASRKLNPAEQ